MFDFLYYCCYCAILKGKKNGSGEERASFMLATFSTVFTIAVYLYFGKNIPFTPVKLVIQSVLIFLLVIGNIYGYSYYFLRNKYYLTIIKRYDKLYFTKRKLLGLFSWILYISAYCLLIFVGVKFY